MAKETKDYAQGEAVTAAKESMGEWTPMVEECAKMAEKSLEIPEADARQQEMITDDQKRFFLDNGFLVVKHVLHGEELKIIQSDMMELYEKGKSVLEDDDFRYDIGRKSGKQVLRRIEYVIDKSDAMKSLLGHPFILKSVEKLQGVNFIPTFDSMVLKAPDEGIAVNWHRDSAHPDDKKVTLPLFNVDFYLDKADLKSCLWVIPGSNKWEHEQASARCKEPGFKTDDAVPVLMEPGDVIFHNILVLHGSPAGDGNDLRRTVYYEFRPGEVEAEFGPHTLEYLALKQQVLFDCIERRKQTVYGAAEASFEYNPQGAFKIAKVKPPSLYRYPHKQYWRH